MKDLRQSPNYGKYMQAIGWSIGRKNGLQFYIRHFPILNNFIKIPRPQKPINPQTIDSLAKKYHAFAVKVDFSPTKTLRLDLTSPLNQIQKQMKKDARYGIKKAKKNKIIVKESNDIEEFIKLWHQNALRRGFWIPLGKEIRSLYQTFDNKALLLIASHYNNIYYCSKPLAGALIVIYEKTAYYFHAASTSEGRKLYAPYLLVWKAIKLTKGAGCQIFDFEGIYDERFPNKSWLGFTHFKKGFGGKEVEYPGAFIKFYNPLIATLRHVKRGFGL
ncbi:peptidoglycan bridge formation glycyltransferase FemA/FemB family protein [Candidatus Gottesmanbacteria bacterium]|nr:peptidoglycan bridge formation glycyltransferase FemA/FemB family protein [Candidatus Gottesmanbacteria bacterium]